MTLVPPITFSERLYLDEAFGEITLTAIDPLAIDTVTRSIGIASASATNSGTMTIGDQTFAGVKTFNSIPISAAEPSTNSQLANKEYVDNRVQLSQSFQEPVESVVDLSLGDPVGAVSGDRYIALTTAGDFVAGRIYMYQSANTYVEILPLEGWVVYVRDVDKTRVFTSGGVWTNLAVSLNHSALEGAGTITHDNIDTHIDVRDDNRNTGIIPGDTMGYTWTAGTFTFAITGVTHVIVAGIKTEIVGNSVTFDAATNGLYFLYFDAAGNLQSTTADGMIFTNAYCFTYSIYLNQGVRQFINDERHSSAYSSRIHGYLHNAIGTVILSGLSLTFQADQDGSSDSHGVFTSTEGVIADEDLRHTIPARGGYPNFATILYRDANGWLALDSTGPLLSDLGVGSPVWNNGTALTYMTSGRYMLFHVFASSNLMSGNRIFQVCGINEYITRVAAREGVSVELETINTNGLPMPEIAWIGSYIIQYNPAYTNAIKVRVISIDGVSDYIDWRKQSLSSKPAVSHGDLSGLDQDDHPQYASIVGRIGEDLSVLSDLRVAGDIEIGVGVNTPAFLRIPSGNTFGYLGGDPGYMNGSHLTYNYDFVAPARHSASYETSRITLGSSDISFYTGATEPNSRVLRITDSGASVTGNISTDGIISTTNTTASTTRTTGCATFAGGVGVAGTLHANSLEADAQSYLRGTVNISTFTQGYNQIKMGGGNTYGALGGNYPVLGDGVSLAYNYDIVANAVFATGGSSSRVHCGYGSISMRVGAVGAVPSTQILLVQSSGVTITGNCGISGTLSKGGGSFDIPHPDETKPEGSRLRHCFVEAPTRGDNLYRYHVTTVSGHATITLPAYFAKLNSAIDEDAADGNPAARKPQCWTNAVNSFANTYANVNSALTQVDVYSSADCEVDVLVIATRKDQLMRDFWDSKGAEYIRDSDE